MFCRPVPCVMKDLAPWLPFSTVMPTKLCDNQNHSVFFKCPPIRVISTSLTLRTTVKRGLFLLRGLNEGGKENLGNRDGGGEECREE